MSQREDFDFFWENIVGKLSKECEGKVLAIKDCKILGVYDSSVEALRETRKEHEMETFIIQRYSANRDSLIQQFHSPIFSL